MDTMSDFITITRTEYERLRKAKRDYEARYEAAAAEMRRIHNQAHAQLAAAMRDIETLQVRVKELEGDK